MARNGNPKRTRRIRAIGVAAALAVTGSGAACSSGSNKPDGKDLAPIIDELVEEALYGTVFEDAISENPYLNNSAPHRFSPKDIGFSEELDYQDFSVAERTGRGNGPVFLQISYVDGQLRVLDKSPSGMDEATKQWILARINDRKEMFLQLVKHQDLKR